MKSEKIIILISEIIISVLQIGGQCFFVIAYYEAVRGRWFSGLSKLIMTPFNILSVILILYDLIYKIFSFCKEQNICLGEITFYIIQIIISIFEIFFSIEEHFSKNELKILLICSAILILGSIIQIILFFVMRKCINKENMDNNALILDNNQIVFQNVESESNNQI